MTIRNSAAPSKGGSANAIGLLKNGAPPEGEANEGAQSICQPETSSASALSMWGIRTPSKLPGASLADANRFALNWRGLLKPSATSFQQVLQLARLVAHSATVQL